MAKESSFQSKVIREIKDIFPDCLVLKNDACYMQGVPDILVLKDDKWAALECKREAKAKHRPNQDYYVDKMNSMSFAAFIYPENEKEILNGLQRALQSGRKTRVSKS